MTDNQINSMFEALQKRIDALDKKYDSISMVDRGNINAITPYVESKTAYYGENYKTFYGVPSGNVSVFFDNYNGEYEISRIEDRLTVSFPERLTDMTSITVMVQ